MTLFWDLDLDFDIDLDSLFSLDFDLKLRWESYSIRFLSSWILFICCYLLFCGVFNILVVDLFLICFFSINAVNTDCDYFIWGLFIYKSWMTAYLLFDLMWKFCVVLGLRGIYCLIFNSDVSVSLFVSGDLFPLGLRCWSKWLDICSPWLRSNDLLIFIF